MKQFAVFTAVLGLALGTPAAAQFPGQYPPTQPGQYPPPTQPGEYPPGTYPPGQGPGTGGISIPKRSKKKQNSAAQPTFSAEGRTISNDSKKLIIATNDGRTISFTLTPQTKFTRSAGDIVWNQVVPRTTVRVEATEDEEAFLTAVHVDLLKDAAPEAQAVAENRPPASSGTSSRGTSSSANSGNGTTDSGDLAQPTILKDPVDPPDRPILRRGKPKRGSSENDSDDVEITRSKPPAATAPAATETKQKESTDFTIDTDSDQPKITRSGSDLIDRTREWSATFTNGLPNFVCQQMTTRYMEQSKASGWEALDVVTAKVVYEDGKEDYKEITVGGKRTNKSMLELGGSTSTGEFASTLRSLFSAASRADFKLYQSTSLHGVAAAIYDFKVALPNSDWFITVGSQTLRPAYSGSVWIDKATAQVRRIEMQAEKVPKDFPMDSMEWAVDYDEVPLGTAKFLLPVHAENLSCQRGSTVCMKNTVDFRDYHKYSGESTIEFK